MTLEPRLYGGGLFTGAVSGSSISFAVASTTPNLCPGECRSGVFTGTLGPQGVIERGRQQIQPVVEIVLSRAEQEGVVREDLAVSDLLLLQHAIGEAAEYTHDVAPEAWRRIMLIALDGVRPDRRRPSPMPVPPLDDEQVVCSMRDWGLRRRR